MIAEPTPTKLTLIATVIAAFVAVVFLGMSVWLTYTFNEWSQVAVVYNAVCAVAFSAFGVLLGSKVQEVNVTRAVQTAERVSTELQKKTEAIKTATKALTPHNEAGGGAGDGAGGGAGGGAHGTRHANRAAFDILINAMD
ncbi:hypothetical protein ACHAC9_20655 [Massilia sp. CMS3.1]|uniref:hypothetical protein n=1 Tax=Massilia sp. CMS3.1 TaxID=3373083 RepID=UPI003EE4ACBD